MDTYTVDITGSDILSRNFGIIVIYNNKFIYAFKLSSDLQSRITNNFKNNFYGFTNQKMLKPKVYSAILTLIIRKIHLEHQTETKNFVFHMCNDFDGHQSDIINFIKYSFLNEFMLFEEFNADNYIFVRHNKKSKIQQSAVKVYSGDWTGIIKLRCDEDSIHNLICKRKNRRNKW